MTEDKKEYDVRTTDSIAEAEKWQNEGFEVAHVSNGKIWMRRKVEDGLFIEYLKNNKELLEKLKQGGEVVVSSKDIEKWRKDRAGQT